LLNGRDTPWLKLQDVFMDNKYSESNQQPLSRSEFAELTVAAARAAGAVHLRYFNGTYGVRTKQGPFDLVTDADLEAEKTVVSMIREQYPDHNILAEENRYESTSSPYTWIIDPLDGTNNFACGVPLFGASVALACNGEVIAGAVYGAAHDEMFSAEKGKGARLNGRPIAVNKASTLQESMLVTGFYYDRGEAMEHTLEKMRVFLKKEIIGIRRFGAAALDLCYVAAGRIAGFWEFSLSPWDFAAGMLIVREAGGRVTTLNDNDLTLDKKNYVVASNGRIHDIMLEILRA
jgi:myo-inositol-1(or 4)-monophosphatase